MTKYLLIALNRPTGGEGHDAEYNDWYNEVHKPDLQKIAGNVSTCPLSYRGAPDRLIGALLYLCSEAGSWTTGQVLHVDRGAVLRP